MTIDRHRFEIDLSPQVLWIEAKPESSLEQVPRTKLVGIKNGFVSAAALFQKAKQFDDGLYAAVELAAQNGAGRFSGKAQLLKRVIEAFGARTAGAELLLAAAHLSGLDVPIATRMSSSSSSRTCGSGCSSRSCRAFFRWATASTWAER